MSEEKLKLTKEEYGQLKRGLGEWSDLVDTYGLGFVGEVDSLKESLDNRVEITYTVPVYDDVEAAIKLLKERHGIKLTETDTTGEWLVECNCGSLVVPGFEQTECVDCGMVHTA